MAIPAAMRDRTRLTDRLALEFHLERNVNTDHPCLAREVARPLHGVVHALPVRTFGTRDFLLRNLLHPTSSHVIPYLPMGEHHRSGGNSMVLPGRPLPDVCGGALGEASGI